MNGGIMSATKRAIAKQRGGVQTAPRQAGGPHVVEFNFPVKMDVATAVNLAQQILGASGWKGTLTVR
jgi:hypothetical protein